MSSTFYDTSYPPSLWGGEVVPATSATAGTPGGWLPAGSRAPTTLANLQGGIPNAVTAVPSTGWTLGQYVQTLTAGAPGEATWTGTGWVGGRSPAEDEATGQSEAPWVVQEAPEAPEAPATAQEQPEAPQDPAS